jgi:L-2-hydroxyglutarate oxidase
VSVRQDRAPLDYCIVGAGIVGLAVARELLRTKPGCSLVVVDKEPAVAAHQTGHNSGVVHAGIYYKPGSAKSTLCRRGVGLLEAFCADHALPFDRCGKLIVAVDRSEEAALDRLLTRGVEAGVPGLERLGPAAVRDVEPNAVASAAVLSPTTAIVDYRLIANAMAEDVVGLGGEVVLSAAVQTLTDHTDVVSIATPQGEFRAQRVVLCGGLHSDRLATMAGCASDPRIVPFRGEYFRLRAERTDLVRGLVYPVPDPRYPFLGVHFTKMIDGGVTVGPNAVLALAREGYRWRDVNLLDVARLVTWGGTWRMARTHWRTGMDEILGSASKRVYARRARRYIPALETADLVTGGAGVRAQAVDNRGTLLDDFAFSRMGRVLAVRNAPSPAATASLAIAERIVQELAET